MVSLPEATDVLFTGILAQETGKPIESLLPIKARIPVRSVPSGVLAGKGRIDS